jgi:hypothetical protein
MRDVTGHNFGLLIAYVLPGVTALWGASYFSPTIQVWLGSAPADAPTVGGFLYLTIAAVAAGLIASTVRWAVIDTLHHLTGVPRPKWDFSHLQRNISAFHLIVEHQYRYYQAYGNTLVSLLFVIVARRSSLDFVPAPLGYTDIALLALVFILFLGSRDTLRKYVHRGNMLFANTRKCRCCGRCFPKPPSPPSTQTEPHSRMLKFRLLRRRILGRHLMLYLRKYFKGEKTCTGGQTPATRT